MLGCSASLQSQESDRGLSCFSAILGSQQGLVLLFINPGTLWGLVLPPLSQPRVQLGGCPVSVVTLCFSPVPQGRGNKDTVTAGCVLGEV